MPRRCSSALAGADPRDPATAASRRARRGRLHHVPREGRPRAARGSAWRARSSSATATPPTAWRRRPSRCSGGRRGRGRPGRHSARRRVRRRRARGAALRAQGRPQRLPRGPRARRRRCARWPTSSRSTSGSASARCRTSGRSCSCRPRRRARLTTPATGRRWPPARRLARAQGIDAVLAKHRLDAIVAPTGNPAWPTDLVNGDHFTGVELDAGRGGALSQRQRADGLRLGPAGRISRSSGRPGASPR